MLMLPCRIPDKTGKNSEYLLLPGQILSTTLFLFGDGTKCLKIVTNLNDSTVLQK